jgi:predicted CopG family antitoxin
LKQAQHEIFLQKASQMTWEEQFEQERQRESELQEEFRLELMAEKLEEEEGEGAKLPVLDVAKALLAVQDDEDYLSDILEELLSRKNELLQTLHHAIGKKKPARSFLEAVNGIKILVQEFGLQGMRYAAIKAEHAAIAYISKFDQNNPIPEFLKHIDNIESEFSRLNDWLIRQRKVAADLMH